jgi:ParB family transcriptional regulator, chromosome partitioning protein
MSNQSCNFNIVLSELDVNLITMNPLQPRKTYCDLDIISLSQSILQNGQLEPVRVVKKSDAAYELIYGHRRLLALKHAQLPTILAIVQPSEGDENLEPAIVENTQREGLNPLDEAEAFAALCKIHQYSLKDLSSRVGKSVSTLSETLKMNQIPEDVKVPCRHYGDLSFRFLKSLSKFGDPDSIRDAYQYYLQHGKLPTRKARQYGNNDKRSVFLAKLSSIIVEYRELDEDKDPQFQKQVREQIELLNSLIC